MDPAEFKAWRKSLGLKQKEAAEKLGLKKRMIQYYETGRRGSKKVVIPRSVELACYAVAVGVERFNGPLPEKGPVLLPATANPNDEKKSRMRGQEAA